MEDTASLITAAAMAWSKPWPPWPERCPGAAGGDASHTQDGSSGAKEASTVDDSATCRICFQDSRAGSLLSPCHCRGSIGLVHKECLEEWLSRKDTNECNVCGYQFKVERAPNSLLDWFNDPSSEAKACITEILLCGNASVRLLVGSCLAAVKAIGFVSATPACFVVGIALSVAGSACVAMFYVLQLRNLGEFSRWRENNRDVRLLLPNKIPEGVALADGRDRRPEPPLLTASSSSTAPVLNQKGPGETYAATSTSAVTEADLHAPDSAHLVKRTGYLLMCLCAVCHEHARWRCSCRPRGSRTSVDKGTCF